jgi:hypothetical protein
MGRQRLGVELEASIESKSGRACFSTTRSLAKASTSTGHAAARTGRRDRGCRSGSLLLASTGVDDSRQQVTHAACGSRWGG